MKVRHLFLFFLFFCLTGFKAYDVLSGKATWYDESWRKLPMASGLMFDANRLEAAHRKLPFGTVVLVRRPIKDGNDLFVRVVITDRGPYAKYKSGLKKGKIQKWKIIDLTPVAAEKLKMKGAGVVSVKVLILKMGTCKSWGSCKEKPFERGSVVKEIK